VPDAKFAVRGVCFREVVFCRNKFLELHEPPDEAIRKNDINLPATLHGAGAMPGVRSAWILHFSADRLNPAGFGVAGNGDS
jgi:hypothetical protein